MTMQEFRREVLDIHNQHRRVHGVPDLELSEKLNTHAQEWAEHLATVNQLKHRDNLNYGENIFCMSGKEPTAEDVTNSWYSEVKNYKFGVTTHQTNTGHFTQMVWKSSKALGVGRAKGDGGRTFIVCNYDPAGNYQGEYAENVFKPSEKSKCVIY